MPFSLSQLINSIIVELNDHAIIKNNQFQFIIDPHFKDYWIGDPVRIKQVILNIVSNSNKFTQGGRIAIFLSSLDGYGIKIKVTDNGIGMSSEQLEQLFNRFEQADKSTTRKFGGTGLGMSISKMLVDMMSGDIEVTSELAKGTSFIVSLPLSEQSQLQLKEILEEQQKNSNIEQTPSLQGRRILLAEDNRINQKIFIKMMEKTNATIIVAENGKEAVELAKNHSFDMVFMDIQMPEMDGVQACEIIKKESPSLPIFALTANVMPEDVEHYLNKGFNDYIAKPIDVNILYRVVYENNIEGSKIAD